MQLTKNFNMLEFDCKDGTKVPYEFVPNVTRLSDQLQIIRDHVGPLHILSGYRTESHNASIGGASHSQHLLGKAADMASRTHSPSKLKDVIEQLIIQGKIKDGGIGLYSSFLHYDIRENKARW